MKITISSYKKIMQNIAKKVEETTQNTLNKVVEYATKQSQNQFDRFVMEVPSDDPYVWVVNTPIAKESETRYSRTIKATGTQLLFIEFGAGVYYYTDMETRLYHNYIPNDRPAGVDEIGNYHLAKWGRSRGSDDIWFYKSQTGRESETAHLYKVNRNNEPIMITHGNRPARALYRGVGMAMRRLQGGKFR